MPRLSAVIITRNEEGDVSRTLRGVDPLPRSPSGFVG
jgi:hypothetical protein